jgi:hypothetical protein
VWVKVQSVVFEPNPTAPTKILIQGAAMMYDGSQNTSYFGYAEPALGSLYYQCPQGDEATCVQEWQDVAKNIGAPQNECVGLGDQKIATGTLHPPGAHPTTADPYPIAMGVLPGFVPCEILGSFLISGSGGSGGEAGAGGSGGSTSGGAGGASGNAGSTASGGSNPGSGGAAGSAAGGGAGTNPGAGDEEAGASGGCSVVAVPRRAGASFWVLAAALALALGRRARK